MANNNISTANVWPHYSASNVRKAASKSDSDTLGKDQFLSILVAQLRNQDPMQPMQDRDFIAQMAQFTSVEQLMNMSGELALLRQSIGAASGMIGKWVQWNEYDEGGNIVTMGGTVDSILSKDGLLYVKVGAKEIGLDYLLSISETQPPPAEEPEEEPGDGEQPDDGSGEVEPT